MSWELVGTSDKMLLDMSVELIDRSISCTLHSLFEDKPLPPVGNHNVEFGDRSTGDGLSKQEEAEEQAKHPGENSLGDDS